MRNRQILLTAAISTVLTLTIIISSLLFISRAVAAPPAQVASTTTQQTAVSDLAYVSVSSLAFVPLNPDSRYSKDAGRQMLTLNYPTRSFAAANNIFAAPLILPDSSILTGMTIFGEDFDSQGAVQLRLKRCDHGRARCLSLAETTSTDPFAAGQFETIKVTIPNEVVNNNFYSYLLELELTALSNSGLRSVRIEMVNNTPVASASGEERWSLTGDVRSFTLPNTGLTQVRVCTDDLSHLDNPTHYPTLVVDGESIPLSSAGCVTVWGRQIELRRRLNTGPSSGTYQFLR